MRYHGIGTDPFEFAVEPVAPPFAPSAFARPAPDPEPVQAPKRLAGPIFPAPGWHVGPAVYASGYGAADASDDKGVWASLSTGTKIGLGVTGVLALGAIGLAIGAFTKSKPKARKNPAKRKNRKNPATLTQGGKSKEVKNLGWLLRNASGLESMDFYRGAEGSNKLVAHLTGGRTYTTKYASYEVFKGFVQRPSFKGVPLFIRDASGKLLDTVTIGHHKLQNPAKLKNPRYKKYPFYVIRKSDGIIHAGFDLREDATYALRHPGEYDYRETKADSAVMTHDGVKRKYGKIEWLKA